MISPFQGDVRFVRSFPFVMKKWESRIYYRFLAHCYLSAESLDVPDGAPVAEWKDTSAEFNESMLPKWFRLWLWLRTKLAEFKRCVT